MVMRSKDRDLYPFCFNISDGVVQAGPPSARCGAPSKCSDTATATDGEKAFVDDGRRLVHHYRQQKVDVRQEQFCEMFSSSVPRLLPIGKLLSSFRIYH